MSASSMPHCCSGVTRPTSSPRRLASTAPTCSTRIRVFSPSRSISGRKDAGRALRDVGATRTTDRGKNSLAWTTTPNRRLRCSWPWPRGIRNSWMSPRSMQTLHHSRDFQHLLPVTLVGFECGDLLGEHFPPLQSCGTIDDRPADRLGPAQSGRFELVQRAQRFIVQAQTNRNSHEGSVSQFVIHTSPAGGPSPSCDRELGEQSVAAWTLRQLASPIAASGSTRLWAVGVQAGAGLTPTDSKEISCSPDLQRSVGAGEGNRTLMTSLES